MMYEEIYTTNYPSCYDIYTNISPSKKRETMMHWSAGSICEGYGPSDTARSDTPEGVCITEAPDGVYIPPMLEMSLQWWYALPHSLFENLLW